MPSKADKGNVSRYPQNRQSRFMACVRCRTFKKKCDATATKPCMRCAKVAEKQGEDPNTLCERGLELAPSREAALSEIQRLQRIVHDMAQQTSGKNPQIGLNPSETGTQGSANAARLSSVRPDRRSRVKIAACGDRDDRAEGRASIQSGINQLRERGWTIGEKLGQGAHGSVYRAVVNSKSPAVAVKFPSAHNSPSKIRHELAMLQLCSGLPNVIQLTDAGDGTMGLAQLAVSAALLTSFFPSITIGEINASEQLTKMWCRKGLWNTLHCACNGLAGIHSRLLVHADIKVSNLVISRDMQKATICDLGLTQKATAGLSKYGTSGYRAPELKDKLSAADLLYGADAQHADTWALGATVLCLAVRQKCLFAQANKDTADDYESMQNLLHAQARLHCMNGTRRSRTSADGTAVWTWKACHAAQRDALPEEAAEQWQSLWLWLANCALSHAPGGRTTALLDGQKVQLK